MDRIGWWIFCVPLLALAGCGEPRYGLNMYHEVSVPKEFRSGRTWVGDISNHERYVEAYERAWWSCIEKYACDINYMSTESDRIGVGWPAAVAGARNGFEDCETRIRENIRHYGEKRTHEHLIEIWNAK